MATDTHHKPETDAVHPANEPDDLAKKIFIITIVAAIAFFAVVHLFIF